jgi:hypothetical protein
MDKGDLKKFLEEIKPAHPVNFTFIFIFLLLFVFVLFYVFHTFFQNIKNFEIVISFLLGIMSLTLFDVLKKQWFAPFIKITSWNDLQELRRPLTKKQGTNRYDYILKVENNGNIIAEDCEISITIKDFSQENVWPSSAMIRDPSEWMPISNESIPWVFLARDDLPRKVNINPKSSLRIAFIRQEGAGRNAYYKISSPNEKMHLVCLKYYNNSDEKISYKIDIHISGKNFFPITKECRL